MKRALNRDFATQDWKSVNNCIDFSYYKTAKRQKQYRCTSKELSLDSMVDKLKTKNLVMSYFLCIILKAKTTVINPSLIPHTQA